MKLISTINHITRSEC